LLESLLKLALPTGVPPAQRPEPPQGRPPSPPHLRPLPPSPGRRPEPPTRSQIRTPTWSAPVGKASSIASSAFRCAREILSPDLDARVELVLASCDF